MEIKIHSSNKHRALGYYLSIIRNGLLKSRKEPFDKLYYADLFCGDGSCIIAQTGKTYSPPLIDSILKPAKRGEIEAHCFLNDLDPARMEKIKEITKEYAEFIEDYSSADANEYYKKVLEKIPADKFSIFFLDPTNHKHLKWKTIEGISKHTHSYYGNQIRRPELIINFMTYTMFNAWRAKDFDSITESIGSNSWLTKVAENEKLKLSAPIEKALVDTFIEQLRKVGYKVPQPIEILSSKNTVYYLIWATNEQGYNIIENRVLPWINKMLKHAQKENKTELRKAKVKQDGISSLEKWF